MRNIYAICVLSSLIILLFVYQVQGNDYTLILDCSSSMGKIIFFHITPDGVTSQLIDEKTTWFRCTQSGYFLFGTSLKKWYTGNVKTPQSRLEVSSSVIPKKIKYAVISSNGEMIAWVSQFQNKSSIVITSHTNVLFSISTNGYICVPAWSPNGLYLAYYYGPPNAYSKDGFSLMMLDAQGIEPKPKEIAPPSLWTRLSPARTTPPSWSPDGSFIIFEARYRENEFLGGNYLFNIDSGQSVPFVWGLWSGDSKFIYTVNTLGNSKVGYKHTLALAHVDLKDIKRTNLGIELPKNCSKWKISDDGIWFAYLINNDGLYLFNVKTKQKRKLIQCNVTCDIQWIK